MLRLPIIKKQVIWLVIGAHLKEKNIILLFFEIFLIIIKRKCL